MAQQDLTTGISTEKDPETQIEHHSIVPSKGSEELDQENNPEDEDFKFTFGTFLAMAGFQLGYMSDVFVLIMASSVLTTINADIGPSTDYSWLAIAQTLTVAAASPFVGRLSDIFGRRNFLLLGNVIAGVGCITCATAHTINTAIGGSVLIGAGSAMHQLAWACLGELVPRNKRPIAFGIFQATLGPASAFSALIAYAFIAHGSWRPIYWLCFAIDAAALILVFFFYHPINQYILEEGKTRWQQVKSLDFIGLFTFVSGLSLFLIGLSFGGSKFPWASAGVLAPMLIGFALLIVCGIYESRTSTKYPLFPRALFANIRGFTVILGAVFLCGMLFYSTAVLWPIQIQALYTTTPITIGLYSMAIGASGSLFSPIIGLAFERIGHSRWFFTAVVAVLCLMCGLQAIVSPGSHIPSTIFVCVIGAAIGGGTVIYVTMVQLTVDHNYIGIATGLLITVRSVGGAVATTIYTTILSNDLESQIESRVVTALVEAGTPLSSLEAVIGALTTGSDLSVLASIPTTALYAGIAALKESYAHALRLVYLVSIAFGVVGVICAAFSNNVDHLMTKKVDIKLLKGAHIHESKDAETVKEL